jgi:hypothetical protein
MVSSSVEITYTNLLINIQYVLDLIAFVDIHLRTYQVKVLVAKINQKDIPKIYSRNNLPDNIVLNLLLFVYVLVQFVINDDWTNKKL